MSNYFPAELLIEILSRVPAKSLVKFISVSKSFYRLIKSPAFIAAHLKNVRQGKIPSSSSLLLIRRYSSSDRKEHYAVCSDNEEGGGGGIGRVMDFTQLDFPLKSIVGYLRIVGTCDGLVCLYDDLFSPTQEIYLWNPSVRNFFQLPPPTIDPPFPRISVLGFGVDVRGDYKIVRIVFVKDQIDSIVSVGVEIYSLNMGFWRRIENVPINTYIADFMWSQAFLNGALHWISYCPRINTDDGGSTSSLILRFDLETELFDEIMLPDELTCIVSVELAVSVYKGLLCVTAHRRAGNGINYSIWTMKKYGVSESWTKLFTMDLVKDMERVVRFGNNNSIFVAKGSDVLVTVDSKTREIQELGIFGSFRSFCVESFEETLVLLGRQNVTSEEERNTKDYSDFEEVWGNGTGESSGDMDGCCEHIGILEI